MTDNKYWFKRGMMAGAPICAGYFAVSFALGIAARDIGMNGLQGALMSAGMVASAGEFAAVDLIKSHAGIIEIIITCIIVNLRYCLMSSSLTQKLSPDTKLIHRFGLAYCITDEIFGVSSRREGYLVPSYTYGCTAVAVVGWVTGTVLGITAGNVLPDWALNALSVALYGMFLAIIVPPVRKDKFIALLVVISMAASYAFTKLPGLREISSGFRIIILTLVIAGIAAVVHPMEEKSDTACGKQILKGNGS